MNIHRASQISFFFYLAFVVYGSLVPLEFRPMPLEEAVTRFAQLPYLHLGINSRADWVANLLLFIPLAFLAMTNLRPTNTTQRVAAAGLALLGCLTLSIGIEFTQLFFPQRTVSQNDVLAETLGGLIGIAAGWCWGTSLERWLIKFQQARGPAGVSERLLWLYLALLFGYNLLPLDLTISVVELYHKWRDGRINFIPFAASPTDPASFLYGIATDILLWVPVSLLLILSGRAKPRRALLLTFAAAALLEGLQLLVYSRFTDTTDLLTATVGGSLGLYIAHRLRPATPTSASDAIPLAKVLLAIVGWCLVLALLFWYPFNFHIEAEWLKQRLPALTRVPFYAYYYGSELRAVTELLHKFLIFMPLGILAARARHLLPIGSGQRWPDAVILLLLLIPAVTIELGQLALPNKNPDSTDAMLEWLGAMTGYFGMCFVTLRWGPLSADAATADADLTTTPTAPPLAADVGFWVYLGSQLLLILALILAAQNNAVPYNVRELFGAIPLPIAAVSLTVALNILFVGPAMAGVLLINLSPQRLWRPLAILFVESLLLYALLRTTMPLESLYDIVGTPILGGSGELETIVRFIALAMFALWMFTGGSAAWCALRAPRAGIFRRWLLGAIPVVLISHWAIVEQAATDNLTELMRGGGSIWVTILLGLWLWSLSLTASLVSAGMAGKISYKITLFTAFLSIPLGYGLVTLATDPQIHKYGQTFSALQFLLSPDRTQLLGAETITQRYVAAHLAVLSIMVLAMYPHWSWIARHRPAWARHS